MIDSPNHLVLVQNFSCEYNKTSDELLHELRDGLDPQQTNEQPALKIKKYESITL